MIRIGIIGLGWWGKQIVTCLSDSPRFKVVAGCDIDTKMAKPFAAAHHFDLIEDYKALLNRPDVDAVAVVTPHLLHEEKAVEAFRAGKHVFCEKPLALTAASAERILAACAKAGGVLGIGHERRYEPAMEEMRRLFETGALGRLLHLDANVSHSNFRRMDPSNWRRDPRHAPAGAWTALGIHLGDMFVSLAGKPTRVTGRTVDTFGRFRKRRNRLRKWRLWTYHLPVDTAVLRAFYPGLRSGVGRSAGRWQRRQRHSIEFRSLYSGWNAAYAHLRACQYGTHEFRGLGRCR
jgi:predicted dehydrogenase